MDQLWAVTVFFNPARYNSLLNNYFVFADRLKAQGVPLLTVELAFNNDDFQIPEGENVHRLRGKSVLWQKERLINYGVSLLPPECKYFAWLDCDVLFGADDWARQAVEKFKSADIIQLFKRIFYLPRGHTTFHGKWDLMFQGVIWQWKIHKNWLERRKNKELPFSSPGFAWAMKRSLFEDIGGIYDKNVVGSGDTFLVDCYLDSGEIHGFAKKFTEPMKRNMEEWKAKLLSKSPVIDYLPIDLYHLWHGNLRNRRYMERHDAVLAGNFDPACDIVLKDNVYEWATEKVAMHQAIKDYFNHRQEDKDE